MKYQIEYSDGKCTFANGRNGLLKRLNLPGNETITDIRKLYKSGVSDSVKDIYEPYIRKER